MKKQIRLKLLKHSGKNLIAVTNRDCEVRASLREFSGIKFNHNKGIYFLTDSEFNRKQLMNHLRKKGWTVTIQKKKKALNKEDFSSYQKRILHEYVSYLRGKRLSENSTRTYYSFVLKFVFFVGNKDLKRIGNRELELFFEKEIAAKKYSISSHRQCIAAIQHLTDLYPQIKIRIPQIHRPSKSRKLPTVLSKEECILLLQATRNLKHRAILGIIYSCGLRIGELLNLELREIDVTRRQIFIRNSKGRKDRIVVLAENILPLIKNYLSTYRPKVFFVEGQKGGKYSAESVRAFLKISCQRAGITKPVTPHTLRHSYATHLLENGVDIRYIQELLGHKSPETTMVYTHISRKDILNIQSPLDSTLKEITEKEKKNDNLLLSRELSR